MTFEILRDILAWASVINIVALLFWFLLFTMAHEWIFRVHGKWFKISMEKFDEIHYGGMALFKIGIFLFNLGPYLAMRIVD